MPAYGEVAPAADPNRSFEPDDPIPDPSRAPVAQEADRKHRPKFVDYFIKKKSDNK